MPDPRPLPLPKDLDLGRMPTHVAIVMDGNGRWAQRQGLPRTDGHAAGEEALVDVVYGAVAVGIKYVTVYAFSTENWRRPVDEVKFLMNFNESLLKRRARELGEVGIRIVFSGRRDWRVPRRVLANMDDAAELTRRNKTMVLNMAFNYGGRAELIDAITQLVEDGVPARKITEKAIRERLYHPEIPDPDLVIRTSGEYRTSNFLMWEMAYSELVFTEVLWPDFRREDLYAAVSEYQGRRRRYGGLDE